MLLVGDAQHSIVDMTAIDNDKEVSDLLASGDENVLLKLPGLLQRFREDHDAKIEVFQTVVASASLIAPPDSYATASSTPPTSNMSLPVSLQKLQDYVPLLRTLLGISEQEAIRIIIIKNDVEDAGSIPFLLDCVDICYHQRAARISAVAELITRSSHDLLDVIDQTTTNRRGSPRGLFRMLLCSSCQHDAPAMPMMRRPDSISTDSDWNAFLRFARDRQVAGRSLERLEALNALLVLLYDYMGAEPVDFGILLAAFFEMPSDNKLKNTVALILAESVALWRTLMDTDENMAPLLDSHPLLKGTSSLDELRVLLELLEQNTRPGWELATLSFGLLLSASNGPLSSEGLILAKRANSRHNVFGTLHIVMSETVIPVESTPDFSVEPLMAAEKDSPSEEADNSKELDSSVLAATIGREIVSATIIAFQPVILPETKLPPIDDLNQLATTTEVIYQNSPTLCKQFWDSWNASSDRPLCLLLKASWRLALQAAESARDGFKDRDGILRAMSPLLQLISTLVYSPETMQLALPTFLPPNIIRFAIDLLKFPSKPEMQSTRWKLLKSLATLSEIGCSDKECREQLRAALEYSVGLESISGPLALASTFSVSDSNSISQMLVVLSNIVCDAPKHWVLDTIRAIKRLQDHQSHWRTSFESKANMLPLAKLIAALNRRLGDVVFQSSIEDSLVVDLVDIMQSSVRSLAANLVVCDHDEGDHKIAALIMDGISLALGQAGPIARFHRSGLVRLKAMTFIDDMLKMLAYKIGSHVFRYAVFPVLVFMLEVLDSTDPRDTATGTTSIFESHGEVLASKGILENSDRLQTIIGEFNVDNLATRDTLGNQSRFIECKAGAFHPALSSLRLLNAWVKLFKASVFHGEDIQRNLVASAGSLLSSSSRVPSAAARLNPILGCHWDSCQIPIGALLMAYVKPTTSDVSHVMATETLSLLSSTISQMSVDVADGRQYIVDAFYALDHFSEFQVAFSKTLEEADFRGLSSSAGEDSTRKKKDLASHVLILTNVFCRLIPRQCSLRLGSDRLERLVTSIHVLTDIMEAIQKSSINQMDLLLMTECACCIKNLWKHERSGYGTDNIVISLVSNDDTLFKNLLHFALEQQDTTGTVDTKTDQALTAMKHSLIASVRKCPTAEQQYVSLLVLMSIFSGNLGNRDAMDQR